MKELSCCPFCKGHFQIKEVECSHCTTVIKGDFKTNRFHIFDKEDLFFIEIFLKNEGNIKLMEKDLNISYPTVKSRLKSIVKKLGYETQENKISERMRILSELSEGKISTKEAMKYLEAQK